MEAGTQQNTSAAVCKNCGSANINNFCAECGQEVFKQRFTVKRLIREWISAFYNYSGGIVFTVKALALKPAETIKEYISGKTIPYWNPFNYFVITFSIFLLMSIKTGALGSESSYEKFTNDYAQYLVIFTIPFISASSTLLFRKTGYNFAENLVLNLFISSQLNIYSTFLLIFNLFLSSKVSSLISILIGFIYFVWIYKKFFSENIISTVIKSLLIYFVQFVVLIILLIFAYFLAKL